MKVIICEPNVPPYVELINGNYKNLKEILGNDIKAIPTSEPNIIIICNLERYENKKSCMENRMNIPGKFLFVGRRNNRLRSLTDDEINQVIDAIRKDDLTVIH
ncbi:DUF3846 domain-containing protein [Calidifontibacillus oryziterrae]|uniref:DUF3846 domain-containing protein n=1 Tax=Calidifontibacillus oryziterrae TaxID=1191699 RepID=UPI000319166E|nr:hypothetical protein [Calidifontibacillus oryziterrae]